MRPGQTVWYLDANGSVKAGTFIDENHGDVRLNIAGGLPPITVREVNTFNTEVAANRAQLNRMPSAIKPGGTSFHR